MTQEDKLNIAYILRHETGCGIMEATIAIEKLIEALKSCVKQWESRIWNLRLSTILEITYGVIYSMV